MIRQLPRSTGEFWLCNKPFSNSFYPVAWPESFRQSVFSSDCLYRQIERRNIQMNRDVLEGQWKQLKGQVKQQWGRLTDDELDTINGRYDELAGLIQERYGYSRDEAANELDMFLSNVDNRDM